MKRKFFQAVGTAAAFFVFAACSGDPEEELNRAAEQAVSGDSRAAEKAVNLLLERISPFRSSEAKIFCDGRVIWTGEDGTADLLYPEKGRFKLPEPGLNFMRAVCPESAVFSDGQEICVFDAAGSLKKRFTAGSEKHPVMAVAVKGDTVYFFRDSRLYFMSGEARPELLVQDRFEAPYPKFFHASMFMNGSRLGLVLGVAGSYYFYLLDTAEKRTLNTKVQMSSPEIYMGFDRVMHVNGDTGKWAFSEFSCSSGKRKKFDVYSDLNSVYVFRDRIITERGQEFFIGDRSGSEQKIPECLEIAGSCRDLVLIRFSGRIYGAQADKLSECLRQYGPVFDSLSPQP